ncbi:sensor histidine kinase [Solimicrobium silvestre]|uniref:sensor histidine kinase n=1 Tax=Solimicrobium silvestre TaxID=2099400 RepID=UPI0013FE0905|nr:histidine kinase [Solimicrobium silvestre]
MALAWLALALFDATQTVVIMRAMGMHHNWLTLFSVTTASWAVWILITPVVLALLQRFRLPTKEVMPWAVHAAACMAIGALWATWGALLEHATNPLANSSGPDAFTDLWKAKFIGNLVGDVILYGAIVALSLTLEAHKRLAQQQAASARLSELLAQTQLAALRLQIEPHFIFNSLNAVTGLIREEKGSVAIAMIAALGDLLRRVTDQSERQFVALEEEIIFLRKYLDIQQMRFAERLRFQMNIPNELMKAQVPDFILQPLVENAIKHGIAKRAGGGELTVVAARDGAVLTLSVYNDGPLLPEQIREGVGVANARRRLLALYGNTQTMTLQNRANAGVLAMITLPYSEM